MPCSASQSGYPIVKWSCLAETGSAITRFFQEMISESQENDCTGQGPRATSLSRQTAKRGLVGVCDVQTLRRGGWGGDVGEPSSDASRTFKEREIVCGGQVAARTGDFRFLPLLSFYGRAVLGFPSPNAVKARNELKSVTTVTLARNSQVRYTKRSTAPGSVLIRFLQRNARWNRAANAQLLLYMTWYFDAIIEI
ncbi:hypothetical protein DFH06DRAFT_1137539 [Mycena polygramma]|nr:hypothetical protein DFH06DRAFT_1137539 [Mycena polygramma]